VVNRCLTYGIGMWCKNAENPPYPPDNCLDYRVRFCCGESNLIWHKSIVSIQHLCTQYKSKGYCRVSIASDSVVVSKKTPVWPRSTLFLV
jgi:hypothetical protein